MSETKKDPMDGNKYTICETKRSKRENVQKEGTLGYTSHKKCLYVPLYIICSAINTANAPTDSKTNAGSYRLRNERSVHGGDGERGADIPKYRPSPLQTFGTKQANDQLPLQVA